MNYRDTLVTCQACSKQFVFTVEKQRQMADAGHEVAVPEMCTACTRKEKNGGKFHGRVKWFNPDKGFGFVVQEDGSELFLHRSGVSRGSDGTLPRLEDGQEIHYDIKDTPKGPQAIEATPL